MYCSYISEKLKIMYKELQKKKTFIHYWYHDFFHCSIKANAMFLCPTQSFPLSAFGAPVS